MGKGGKGGKVKPFTPADKSRIMSSAAKSPTRGKVALAKKVQSKVDSEAAKTE